MRNLIRQIFPEIMEKMFFMVPEELEGGTPMPRGDFVAEATLQGEREIAVRILVPEPLASAMAKNLFPDEEPSRERLKDILKELVNMLGGGLIMSLGPGWKLGLPRVYEGVEAFGLIGGIEPALEYDIDGEPLAIYLEG